jgi:hypothetical protein
MNINKYTVSAQDGNPINVDTKGLMVGELIKNRDGRQGTFFYKANLALNSIEEMVI